MLSVSFLAYNVSSQISPCLDRNPPRFPRPAVAQRSLRTPPDLRMDVSHLRVLVEVSLQSRQIIIDARHEDSSARTTQATELKESDNAAKYDLVVQEHVEVRRRQKART